MNNLGDRWGAETSPVETNPVSVEYWRQKATEFQSTINAVDAIANDSLRLMAILPESPERDAIADGYAEFESKKTAMRFTAEGINMGAAVINAAGGRFPVLSLPSALGLGPMAMPAAALTAFTAAAGLIAWAVAWNRAQVSRINSASAVLDYIEDPAERARVAAEIGSVRAQTERTLAASESPLASIAGIAKWAGVVVLAVLAYRAWNGARGGSVTSDD